MRRRTLLTLPPLLAVLAACGCGVFDRWGRAPDDPTTALTSDAEPRVLALSDAPYVGAAVTACDGLGAAMLSHVLDEDRDRNAVVCPAGTGLVLAMLYAGATELPDGLDRLLGFEATASYPSGLPAERDTAWSALRQSMQRLDVDDASALEGFDPDELPERPLLHVANRALLVRPEKPDGIGEVYQEYLDDARTWYAAEVTEADAADAKDSLDTWARLHTGGLVPTSAMSVNERTRLVLQNAVLLAARWRHPFDAGSTWEDGTFHRADGTTSTVPLMHQTEQFPLVSGKGWRALRMLYASTGGDLVMDLILPDDVVHPAQLPPGTWAEASARLESSSDGTEVRLGLPRLDLASGEIDLLDVLGDLGTELGNVPHVGYLVRVGQAAQQVRLRVDEDGTVGAALTEVEVETVAVPIAPAPPPEFICDHPFVLRVVDRASGVCVIEAAVVDPAAG